MQNPYDALGLNPYLNPDELTAELRARIERENDEDKKAELRAIWEELTLHPMRRAKLAVRTFLDSEPLEARPPALQKAGEATQIPASLSLQRLSPAEGSNSTSGQDNPTLAEDPIVGRYR